MRLPDELLVLILQNLDCRYLLRCCRVSKTFKAIIEGTAALQYTIELAVSGQRDNPLYYGSASNSSKEKLERLEKHQQAWNELKPSRKIEIPSTGDIWVLYGGVLAQNTPQGEIQFHQLPSDLRDVEEKQWSLPADFGFDYSDFGMDPGQDLLVLVETLPGSGVDATSQYRVHFYTMSTGKPHPLAKRSMVALPQTPRDPGMFLTIQVFGDHVGIHFRSVSEMNLVALWDWQTGELQVNICGKDIADFTLLSDRWMLIAYSDSQLQEAVGLGCVDFVREPSTLCARESLRTLIELECPPSSDRDVYLEEVLLRADAGCFVDNRPGGAFLQGTEDFVVTLTVSFVSQNHIRSAIQFICGRRLVDLLEEYPPFFRDPDVEIPDRIDWDDWVPNTRIRIVRSSSSPSAEWLCYVYGNRFILGTPMTVDGERGFKVEIMDFNQLALKRDAHLSTGLKYPGDTVTQPTKTRTNYPYDEEVVTSLPFRRQSLFLGGVHRHCKAMCTEDAIVIVDPSCSKYRVLVF